MNDLELLKRYLQNEIDIGSYKIFAYDKDYNAIEFKVIEALNEIKRLQEMDKILRNANINLKLRINKAIEYIEKWQSFPHTNGSTHRRIKKFKKYIRKW